MALPAVGERVPAFSLRNQNGDLVKTTDYSGRFLVLYFYPKAMTPGCTVQACGLKDSLGALESFNATAVGISPDPVAKLKKFVEKEALNFDLLSDENHIVAEQYGVWRLKKFMGREYMGVLRTTFIIGPDGILLSILDQFSTKSHHLDVVSCLKSCVRATSPN